MRRAEAHLCAGCRTRLREPAHPRCPRCHAPRGTGIGRSRPCPECDAWPRALAAARAAFVMAPPADSVVHALKYGGWPELAPFMAERMTMTLRRERTPADALVVPVPTTRAREKERGYNQAGLLAREIARDLGLPCRAALRRREGATTQTALHRAERLANVREAFQPADGDVGKVEGRAVILVDDVLTTGATASAASEVLARAGAAEVRLIVFARALPSAE